MPIITVDQLVRELRLHAGTSAVPADVTETVTRLHAGVIALIDSHTTTDPPDDIKNLAVIRLATYIIDSPDSSPGSQFANSWVNSGASALLARYIRRSAVTIGEDGDTTTSPTSPPGPVDPSAPGNDATARAAAAAAQAAADSALAMIAALNATYSTDAERTAAVAALQAAIDAIVVQGGAASWAAPGNTDPIPVDKLRNIRITGQIEAAPTVMRLALSAVRVAAPAVFDAGATAVAGMSDGVAVPDFPDGATDLYVLLWLPNSTHTFERFEVSESASSQNFDDDSDNFPQDDSYTLEVDGVDGRCWPSADTLNAFGIGLRFRAVYAPIAVEGSGVPEAWSTVGNDDPIPAPKLTNAPGGTGVDHIARASAAVAQARADSAISLIAALDSTYSTDAERQAAVATLQAAIDAISVAPGTGTGSISAAIKQATVAGEVEIPHTPFAEVIAIEDVRLSSERTAFIVFQGIVVAEGSIGGVGDVFDVKFFRTEADGSNKTEIYEVDNPIRSTIPAALQPAREWLSVSVADALPSTQVPGLFKYSVELGNDGGSSLIAMHDLILQVLVFEPQEVTTTVNDLDAVARAAAMTAQETADSALTMLATLQAEVDAVTPSGVGMELIWQAADQAVGENIGNTTLTLNRDLTADDVGKGLALLIRPGGAPGYNNNSRVLSREGVLFDWPAHDFRIVGQFPLLVGAQAPSVVSMYTDSPYAANKLNIQTGGPAFTVFKAFLFTI